MSTIAKRLGCSWNTARTWCHKWEETRQALSDQEDRKLDLSESVVLDSIRNGNTADAKWYLAMKGRKRGFTPKQEVTGPDGAPIEFTLDMGGARERDGSDTDED